ncbi:hypothetical protein MMC07_000268 [Pseudocyphellaria aurata]|nr:hypothetical protein [Pseudocyphellaria aurata]
MEVDSMTQTIEKIEQSGIKGPEKSEPAAKDLTSPPTVRDSILPASRYSPKHVSQQPLARATSNMEIDSMARDIEKSVTKKPEKSEPASDDLASYPPVEDSILPAGGDTPKDVSPQLSASDPFDMEIDQLTQKLTGLIIKDSAPAESSSVTVPAGFRLDMEIGPTQFYKLREEIKKNNKRKRELGLLSRSSAAKIPYGFRPEDVLLVGVSLKDCRPSNLSNDVHPLLHHSRFDDCPDNIYDELMPGLRLATMFLTQPICSQFWLTLANGERKTDSQLSRKYGANCQRIEKNVPMTKENTAAVIEYIKNLDKAKKIHWSFQHDLVIRDTFAYGVTKWVCENHHELHKEPDNTLVPQHIRIHSDMYTVASKLSKLEYADTAQKLRFSFFVAVLICHELAHAVEGAHRLRRPLGKDLHIEPWLFNDDAAEMGYAWESMTLGGTVHPINAAVDCVHGIGTWDWPEVDPEVNWERSLKYAVPMSYIEKLFQMETWQREFDLKDWKTFHIPRERARSLNMNNLTTMPWSEVVRVNMEEALDASKTTEPAAKKRELENGQAVSSSLRFDMESTDEDAQAPNLEQTIQQQERTIQAASTMSRKQRRNQKKAERNAAEDDGAVPNKGDAQALEQTAEGAQAEVDPKKPVKKNKKQREKLVEEVVDFEKDRPTYNVTEIPIAAILPQARTAEKQTNPAPEILVSSKAESSAEEKAPETELFAISKRAPSAHQPKATSSPAMPKKLSPTEAQDVASTEPVLAEAQAIVVSKLATPPTASLDAPKTKK